MTKIDAFRRAVAEIGDGNAAELSAFIESNLGVVIPPSHIPIFRATLQFQKSEAGPTKSDESSCLPKTEK